MGQRDERGEMRRLMWGCCIGIIVCLRVFVNERGSVVDFVVDDDVEIFLGGVLRYFFVGDFFGHVVYWVCR